MSGSSLDQAPVTGRVTLGRRGLLLGGATVLALGGLSGRARFSRAAEAAGNQDFLVVSRLLVGRPDLNDILAERYEAALRRHHADFGPQFASLKKAIDGGGFQTVEALFASPLPDADRQTAMTIISAWYLGIVGEAADVELIAFSDALMYAPCADVLVVPSYGAGPLAWGEKPPLSTVPAFSG